MRPPARDAVPMPRRRESNRTSRVGKLLCREMATLIVAELHAPQVALVAVTGIKLSRDLRFATFYVSCTTPSAPTHNDADVFTPTEEAVVVLREASAFLRHRLSQTLDLRITPQIRFQVDRNVVADARLAYLLAEEERKRG